MIALCCGLGFSRGIQEEIIASCAALNLFQNEGDVPRREWGVGMRVDPFGVESGLLKGGPLLRKNAPVVTTRADEKRRFERASKVRQAGS